MFFTPLLPGGVIGTDTGTLRRQVKVKRKTQPNQSMTIDWSNPITKGLIFAYNGVTNTDLVKRAKGDKQNIAVDSIGKGTNITGTTDVVTISARNNTPVTNNLSFFSLFTTTVSPVTQSATNNYGSLFCKRDSINPERISFYFAGGALNIVANDSLGVSQQIQLSGGVSSIGRTTACATGSINGSVGYINGKQTGTGIATYWPAGTSTWKIGLGRADAPTETLTCIHHLDLCWNRTLTAAEVASLNANPWQLFKSTPQTMVATRGIVSRPNSDISVTNNTITIRRQVKVKRKTQPQMTTQIDWSNPVTKHIVGYWTPTVRADVTSTNNPQQIVTNIGKGLLFVKASAQRITVPLSKPVVLTNTGASILTICFATNNTELGGFVGISDGASYFSALLRGDLGVGVTAANWNGSNYGQWSSPTLTNNEVGIYVVTINAANTQGKVYKNGVNVTTTQSFSGALSTSSLTTLSIGSPFSDGGDNLSGGVYLAVAFNKVLSPSEVSNISKNPWQIFESTPQTMVYTKPGGGWSYNSNTSLYDAIDEPSYNDTDAIISPNLNASPEPAKFGLDTSLDAGTYNVNVRARRTDTTGDIRATLIDSAGIVVGTSSWQTLTDIYQTYVLSVTTTATASRVGLEVRA